MSTQEWDNAHTALVILLKWGPKIEWYICTTAKESGGLCVFKYMYTENEETAWGDGLLKYTANIECLPPDQI